MLGRRYFADLRHQALRENLSDVDSVLITHQHLDHIMGFDDLRSFCWHKPDPLPLYGGPKTLAALKHMFNTLHGFFLHGEFNKVFAF